MQQRTTSRRPESSSRVLGAVVPLCVTATFAFALSGCTQYSPFRNTTPAQQSFESMPPARPNDRPATAEVVTEWSYQESPAVPAGYQPTRRLQRFSFAPGSATLNREAQGALLEIVDDLKVNTRWHLLAAGFTDRDGEVSGNPLELSTTRTKAVRTFLVERGIDESRISTMALGSRYAEGDQYQPAATASDRRVEVWAFMN